MPEKTYTVHRSMHGDGIDYEPGDERKLDEADAAPLLEMGAISPKGEPPRAREPGVRHAFGNAETTGHLSTTTATDDERMLAGRGRPKHAEKASTKA